MQHVNTQSPTHLSAQGKARTGATLSALGLLVWLAAMALAVAGPLLGMQVPPAVIIGMVVFSGLFSLLSLPRILGLGDPDK